MKVSSLLRDEGAVSSVLGVVLMVAVTIVLAAVIGTFVLGIGEDLTDPSPTVTFDYSATIDDDPNESSRIVVLHSSGDQFESQNVEITIDDDLVYANGQVRDPPYTERRNWPYEVTAGDRLEIEDSGQIETGDTIRVYWSDGEHAAIIDEHQIG